VKVWDAASGYELATLRGHTERLHSVAFSPEGRRLASAGVDGTVRVWDVTSSRELKWFLAHPEGIWGVAFSPDGTCLASAGTDGTVKIWDVTSGRELLTLKGHTDTVYGVAFNPDGQRLASGSDDRTVKVWDVASGQELRTLKGHKYGVWSVAFSPDGQHLASASSDRTVRVWDGRPLTREVQAEREALRLVQFLFAKPLFRQQVIERLRDSPGLRDEVRRRALLITEGYADGPQFNAASWAILRKADGAADRYRRAVTWAQTAHGLDPENGAYLTTLGVAQYRAGEYRPAVATLTRAAQRNAQPVSCFNPADLAFLAMAHQGLGQKAEAQACLGRLREQIGERVGTGNAWWPYDEDTRVFVRQAEVLVDGARP
ncbi:MAG: hypothetical protein L0Z62_27885, partial [Gemmataceae bacterium]|nr:hypothetical protein [Gemmataceae bacterium]